MKQEQQTTILENFWPYLVKLTTGKLKQRQTPQLSTFSHRPNRDTYTCSPKDIYKNVHSSTIFSSPKLETTQIYITVGELWYIHTMEYYRAMGVNKLNYIQQNR